MTVDNKSKIEMAFFSVESSKALEFDSVPWEFTDGLMLMKLDVRP